MTAWTLRMPKASHTCPVPRIHHTSPQELTFAPKPRVSMARIIFCFHDLFLQYVQDLIKWLPSIKFLFHKCHHSQGPSLVISQVKRRWVTESPLNHVSLEKAVLERIPTVVFKTCLLALMTILLSAEEYCLCGFTALMCYGTEGYF